jgi:hypothetical protein
MFIAHEAHSYVLRELARNFRYISQFCEFPNNDYPKIVWYSIRTQRAGLMCIIDGLSLNLVRAS